MFVEGQSPSTHIRSRNPAPSKLTKMFAMDGVSIEVLDEESTTPSKRYRVIDGACSSKFRIHAWKRLPGTDCFGPADIGRRILRSLLITAPQDWERRLEESTWASSTRLIVLLRVLRLSCPNPLVKRLETVLCQGQRL